jgi:hypothetical protein
MHARWILVLALALGLGAVARGQDEDADTWSSDPDSSGSRGTAWFCFAASVGAIGGLYVLVRRRQQAAEANWRGGRGPAVVWYCRECDRDVSGSKCPHCRAANPFVHEVEEEADTNIPPVRPAPRPARVGQNGRPR